MKELHQIVILTWWSCFKILEFFLDCRLLLILQHFHHKIQEVLRYSDAELNVTSHKKGVFFHPKNIRGELRPFFPYLNMRTISITTSGISSFSGFRTLNVSSVIKNPTRLRNEVIFWAISANLTDLLMTDQDFLDNLMEANIKPDALTSDDLLKFAVNPKNTICQSDLPTKIIVSEKISSSDIQVNFHFWIFQHLQHFFPPFSKSRLWKNTNWENCLQISK